MPSRCLVSWKHAALDRFSHSVRSTTVSRSSALVDACLVDACLESVSAILLSGKCRACTVCECGHSRFNLQAQTSSVLHVRQPIYSFLMAPLLLMADTESPIQQSASLQGFCPLLSHLTELHDGPKTCRRLQNKTASPTHPPVWHPSRSTQTPKPTLALLHEGCNACGASLKDNGSGSRVGSQCCFDSRSVICGIELASHLRGWICAGDSADPISDATTHRTSLQARRHIRTLPA